MSAEQERTGESCSNCRFYRAAQRPTHVLGECRRHAPPAYDFLRFYHLELIRFAALSLGKLARIDDVTDEEDVMTEATEAMADAAWPQVRPEDWCGEHKIAIE